MDPGAQSGLPHARYERFESTRELEDMFDELVPETQRSIRIFDRALSGRYDTSARCALLREFLRADPLNELLIALHETGRIERELPRFVSVLQQFGHKVKIRQTPRAARHIHDPFAIFDGCHYLHRFHYDQMRFARGRNEVSGAQSLLERHAELWDASTPAGPGTVLGL